MSQGVVMAVLIVFCWSSVSLLLGFLFWLRFRRPRFSVVDVAGPKTVFGASVLAVALILSLFTKAPCEIVRDEPASFARFLFRGATYAAAFAEANRDLGAVLHPGRVRVHVHNASLSPRQ